MNIKKQYPELTILIISILLFIYTYFAHWAKVPSTTKIGLTFFPRIILLLCIFSSVVLLFLFRENISIHEDYLLNKKQKIVLIVFPLSMIALIFVVWHIGLIIGMYIFLISWMYFLGLRSKRVLFLLPLSSSIFVYFLFKQADIFIPEGLLF